MVPLVCKERKGKFQDYSNQANHYKYLFLQRCKSTVDTSTVKNCTQTLMEWKRGWHPSLNNATEGLSPFCVLELSMDEVATINDRYDTLKKASAVTVGDVDKAKASVKASVPDTADEFITLLKQYANLLFALFLGDCPLFKCVANVVNCIRNYSLAARKAMTKASNVSILWIIILQSRKFAIGEFEILVEFTSIQALLCKKILSSDTWRFQMHCGTRRSVKATQRMLTLRTLTSQSSKPQNARIQIAGTAFSKQNWAQQ